MQPPSIQYSDTIVALSTPPGRSAIGLIRMSGPDALPIAQRVFHTRGSATIADRKALYGHILDPQTSQVLDDGLLVFMKEPHSYTGEDMVEISLHGSPVVLDNVTRLLITHGARLATRGEFTRRAFLNGKLDLLQAEAVIDFIEAQSCAAADEARSRLDSSQASRIKELSNAIKNILASIEAHIDFDEDDELELPYFFPDIQEIVFQMETIRRHSEKAVLIRDGIRVCITGKPNVGKSTLFNALLRKDRAIVTPIPGTTRDPVEDRIILGNNVFALWDTAGIREPEGIIEDEGIRRTLKAIDQADLILAVIDGSNSIDSLDQKVLAVCKPKELVLVINKIDLVQDEAHVNVLPKETNCITVSVSAKTGWGIDKLEHILADNAKRITSCGDSGENPIILSNRCLNLLDAAMAPLERIIDLCQQDQYPALDIVSYELRAALGLLEEITGEKVEEGILDRVFERFCVGK